MICQQCDLRV